MRDVSLLPLAWRALLAISLVGGSLQSLPAAAQDDASAVAPAAPMPCHPDPPPPPAGDAPCDDGCCPQPDCDLEACRGAGALVGTIAPVLPGPIPATPVPTTGSSPPPDVRAPRLLRPPIG